MIRYLTLLLFFTFYFIQVKATHNRAGEITYSQDINNPLLYHFTIVTYVKTSSPADRPELEICWGDGTCDSVPRISKTSVGPDISMCIYKWDKLYAGPSTYFISCLDPNRNGGVINIPGSVNVPFYIDTKLIISPFLGYNNSPVLLQPPIDDGIINVPFIHNPNAYDPDGDSLSYELIFCKGTGGQPIPGYFYPNASNSFSLNVINGDLIWDSPTACGEYNVAFLIKEWRNGVNIGYVERDMQITIFCVQGLDPPVVSSINDICVDAGTFISFNVTATDPNNEYVTISATGAPFSFSPDAASFPEATAAGTVTSTFTWQTSCGHVRRLPYQIVFTARDSNTIVNLADLEAMNITVVGPAPQNPQAAPLGSSVILNWDQSICPEAIGYKIYRRNGFYGFVPSQCETGVPVYTGYTQIANVTGLTNTTFTDNNNGTGLINGIDYCYMIVAYYPDSALSYASVEVCTQLKKDIPVITNVSVIVTDAANGVIDVAWSKPTELDTIQFPGPYEYRLFRSPGFTGSNYVFVASVTDLNDTTYTDTGLNTIIGPYSYKIELHNSSNGFIGKTQNASSVFLSIAPSDHVLNLSWNETVPWNNSFYVIYRQNGAVWDSIGFSTTQSYSDTGVVNGQLYCYYVKSVGDYSGSGFVSPIENLSQQTCSTPFDNIPPCSVTTFDTLSFDCFEGRVTFTWQHPEAECAPDVGSYNIYYSPDSASSFILLATITDLQQLSYSVNSYDSLAGCYYVTAVDTNGNESVASAQICLETCPYYELPNVFTPDNQGANDVLNPFPYRYVESIELVIFNRWGMEVFSTNDPDINWNGRKNNTGQDLPEGVYYYICTVNERYSNGIRTRVLKPGFVHLLRGASSGNN